MAITNTSSKNEIYKSLIKYTLIVIFVVCSSSLSSQLNVKVGYNLNYSEFQSNNALLAAYNEQNPWLADEFNALRFLNGVQLGARLRNEFMGIDFTYERSAAERTASGLNLSGNNITNQLNYQLNRFSLGLEAYVQAVGLGVNISHERFNIKQPISGLDSQSLVINDDRFANRIYLIFSSPGSEKLSISLQPYISIPWRHYNISALDGYLGTATDKYNVQENLHFGISLVFYNGPQI